jgi:hypothetical protein
MTATVRTPGASIDWTNIKTQGTDRDVLRWDGDDLELTLGATLDQGLVGKPFQINWRLIRTSDGHVFNYPVNYYGGVSGTTFATWLWWPRAKDAGVSEGLFLFKPYVYFLQAREIEVFGQSEFAVADDHYFLVEYFF